MHLLRAGTIRLLGIINEQIEIVGDFAYCAYNDQSGDHTEAIVTNPTTATAR